MSKTTVRSKTTVKMNWPYADGQGVLATRDPICLRGSDFPRELFIDGTSRESALVVIDLNTGAVKLNVEVDEAARLFWEAVEKAYPWVVPGA